MVCQAFIPLDFGVMEGFPTMNIYQTAFCVLLAHSISNFSGTIATLSFNLIQKTCKSFIYNKKWNEKREMDIPEMSLNIRMLSIALPIISVILWVLVFYYSLFDDAKAATLSYFACASLIFISKYVFLERDNVNSVYLKFLNYLAFFLMFAGCLLISNQYMTAFYVICLGILLFKMKYEVEQMQSNYFFEDVEVSRGNLPENITRQDLTVEGLTDDSTAYSECSKVEEQSTDVTERKANGFIKSDHSDDAKNKEDACEKNHCSKKTKDSEELHDNLNESAKYSSESSSSEKILTDYAFQFSKELYSEPVDQVIDRSHSSESVSWYKKDGIAEMRSKLFQKLVEGYNANAVKVESVFTKGSQHNAQISSAENTSDKTCLSVPRASKKAEDKPEACASEVRENDAVYRNNTRHKVTSTINDVIKPNGCSGNQKFCQMVEKKGWHDQKELFACNRQVTDEVCEDIKSVKEKNIPIQTNPIETQMTDQTSSYSADINVSLRKFNENNCINVIDYSNSNERSNFENKSLPKHVQMLHNRQQLIDKVCEDIKSKIKDNIQTYPFDETEEFYRLAKQSSMFSQGVSGPPCIINKTDQMSSYPADMINVSLRKFNENKCINETDYPISNEKSNCESKSNQKHTQTQSSGKDSSSTAPLFEKVAKSTEIEDSEFYRNSCAKRSERLGMQSENDNSDIVRSENKTDESVAGVSAVANVTGCSSAISSVAGTVNRIDVRFIYGVGHSLPRLNFNSSNYKL